MRYFVCAFGGALNDTKGGVSLGIPAERTERVISAGRAQAAVCETVNGETFISLPLLFGLEDSAAPHGIVLKHSGMTLLTPKIDIDLEIPEEEIHRLPEALTGLHRYFRGVYFSGRNLILILNPDGLMESSHD